MSSYIERETALSYPFANGQYDKAHADPAFIRGCESYRDWLEKIPAKPEYTEDGTLVLYVPRERFEKCYRVMLCEDGSVWVKLYYQE